MEVSILLGDEGEWAAAPKLRARLLWIFDVLPLCVLVAFATWMVLRFWLGINPDSDEPRTRRPVWYLNGHALGGTVRDVDKAILVTSRRCSSPSPGP